MRGKITDQDLINYALNDGLESRERLYVESMLAISEECRGDVYRNIDMAQMLEEGFGGEQEELLPSLTSEQRQKLLTARPRVTAEYYLRNAAVTMALAACAAFAIVHPQFWQDAGSKRMAQVTHFVDDAFVPQSETDISSLVMPTIVETDEDSALMQTSDPMPDANPQPAAICTPPAWQQDSDSTPSDAK